ncbi:hypothetical protein AB4Z34_14625 [Ensifer sp. 2YAB10]
MAIERDTEFEILLKLWIAGDVPIDGIRRRYITLLRERQRGRKVD